MNPTTTGRRACTGALGLSALLSGLALLGAALAATPDLPSETRQALVTAVEAAAALDFYNARCRSDESGRHSDNLSNLLVSKLHLTIMGVQDDLFPERGFRAVQQRLREQFTEDLRQAGGCPGAKASGVADQLSERYRRSVTAIEALL